MIAVLAFQAAVLLEPLDTLGIQNLAPDIGVIAGRVSAHDVTEVGRAVTRRNNGEVCASFGEYLRLRFHQRFRGRNVSQRDLVQLRINDGRGKVLARIEALIELLGGNYFVEQFLGYRFRFCSGQHSLRELPASLPTSRAPVMDILQSPLARWCRKTVDR